MDTHRIAIPEGAKAQRVYLSLRDEMANGFYIAGASLPGEQKLAQLFEVSRVTIRRALKALCSDGWVERRAGSGTIVCDRPSAEVPVAMDFSTLMPQLAEMGRSTTVKLLSFAYGAAPAYVAEAMTLSENEKVQIATRVRLNNGQPFSHLTTYVPENIARNYSESDLANTPLFTLLERSGVTINDAHQSVSATLASPDIANALDIAVGSALLSVQRVVRDSDGRGVEYLSARYRPDLFRLDMSLARVGDDSSRYWEPSISSASNRNDEECDHTGSNSKGSRA
ncbi:MAG: GntR family transcriptional regulator [bacterium]